MVGEFVPAPNGEFDPETFSVNPEFVAAFVAYMNLQARSVPEFGQQARERPGERLFIVDPRNQDQGDTGPPEFDILGGFDVNEVGEIVPDSFQYNANHQWFSQSSGISGIFFDRRFYAALHPEYAGGPMQVFQHDENTWLGDESKEES
jgi:hypothetical protein